MNYEKSESLGRYFKSIQNLNPLTKEEELELAKRIQAGDQKALNRLVEHNLKIVITIANNNVGRGIPVDDLIQQGNMGLLEAAVRFNPEENVRFASFAGTRILKSMNNLIDNCGRIVRIPVNQEYERYLALKKGEEVQNLTPVKLDDFINDDEEGATKGSRILSVRPDVEREFEFEHFKIKVNHLLNKLKERDREVLKLYYGIDCEEELETKEIATRFGLTQIRVCQIINSAKRKLQKEV